ncbi:MAG: serpin family protein [Planctomycetota bacterium]|jgi:serine protease inhibitor|nr:serpin family protein [Planctomycetota bacterium]
MRTKRLDAVFVRPPDAGPKQWQTLYRLAALMVFAAALSAQGSDGGDAPSRRAAAAVNAFSVDLFKALAGRNGGNIVVSPYSLARVLAVAASGAGGETRRELLSALRLDPADRGGGGDALAPFAALGVQLAAAGPFSAIGLVIHARDLEISAAFTETAGRLFGIGVEPADFSNPEGLAKAINSRVRQGARGMIGEFVDASSFPSGARLAVIDAAAFAGEWSRAFPAEDTHDGEFESPEGTVTAAYMSDRSPVRPFVIRDGAYGKPLADMLGLPFRDGGLEMLFLKPENMNTFMDALTPDSLAAWLEAYDVFRAEAGGAGGGTALRIPKFSFSHDAGNLASALEGLGIRAAFSGDADFSGIAGGERLRISSALHKARIEVDEAGARAAAAGAAIAVRETASRVEFRLDRPFLFFVRHPGLGALPVLGKVVKPVVE